ncbi:MAG: G/U mismatch-specific DNA glycosylase [Chloroflexota bacterium]
MKLRKPTKEELVAAQGTTVPDIIAPNLDVLFCGINPSVYSAVVGHHFARPGNRFWPTLHNAGFTPRLLTPAEDGLLLEYGLGLTNVFELATVGEKDVSTQEFVAGGQRLEERVLHYTPKVLAILGIGAYRKAFRRRKAVMGRQDEHIGDTLIWVLPNPSGLNAHYQLPDLARVYRELHEVVQEL